MQFIHSILSNLRWQDVVDILLISFVLFRFYVLFKGTIVFRGVIAIILLLLFERIVAYLGLILTSWFTQGITAVAALIVIVVFRNEIRGVFQTRSFKAALWGISSKPLSASTIDVIVESVFEISKQYVGALIVIPGKKDIKDIVQNGVSWQGVVSKEMILSIFWPDNPVHDGAAIIQNDRISDVGVILPLSIRKDIPSYYGTRHRAALGLSEATDALVIVVSEESGRILAAHGNQIYAIHRKQRLSELLLTHIGFSPDQNSLVKREQYKAAAAAVISFLLVTSVWFSVSRGFYTMVSLEAPIEYMNLKPEMEIFDTSVNSVQLHLSGSGALIKSVGPEQVQVKIDMNNAVPGDNTFSITSENIVLPPGVFLKKVDPSFIEASLDIPITKMLPVQVDWVGSLPPDVLLTKAKLKPETVQIIGPGLKLREISTLFTQKVKLENLSNSGRLKAKLAFDLEYFKAAPGSPDKVTVEYTIGKRENE
jgi:uncharacterized protein (TIGR00159 family)